MNQRLPILAVVAVLTGLLACSGEDLILYPVQTEYGPNILAPAVDSISADSTVGMAAELPRRTDLSITIGGVNTFCPSGCWTTDPDENEGWEKGEYLSVGDVQSFEASDREPALAITFLPGTYIIQYYKNGASVTDSKILVVD